jgi:hypothetical protein
MESNSQEVFSLVDFLTALDGYSGGVWLFRGQAVESWQLRPKVGRPEYLSRGEFRTHDLQMFHEWRDQAGAFTDSIPADDFECLAYAQHHGLATRLLDWSANPLVALYFAVETHPSANGAVFAHCPASYLYPKTHRLEGFDRVAAYRPKPFDQRLLSQATVFTYHPHPDVALTPGAITLPTGAPPTQSKVDMAKIIIRAEAKPLLFTDLEEIGISRKTLFPSLEGLSASLNWKTKMLLSRSDPSAQ